MQEQSNQIKSQNLKVCVDTNKDKAENFLKNLITIYPYTDLNKALSKECA